MHNQNKKIPKLHVNIGEEVAYGANLSSSQLNEPVLSINDYVHKAETDIPK